MDVIVTNLDWEEQGFLECDSIDIENGEKNDFEIRLKKKGFQAAIHKDGNLVFLPNTEWGGIIKTIHPNGDMLYLGGPTWRGRLDKSIVEPDAGEDYLRVTGDANTVIGTILRRQGLDGLFKASEAASGIRVTNYPFPRYYSVLQGINSMLASRNGKLCIRYIRGPANGVGYVEVAATRVRDYSEQIEINNDMQINYDIKVNRFMPNHLICLGKGQLKERLVAHLYLDKKGKIVDSPYYIGLDEISEVYELPNEEDLEKLKAEGVKKFKELIQGNTVKASLSTDRLEVDIGDIVSGRERVTGLHIRVPVTRKILTIRSGRTIVEYKLKGE